MQSRQKADVALQARKKAAARKKETEQRQVETLNRKHLAGLRVVQKNLVYVVGLSQKSSEEEFLQTLRGDQYFGQYGKIIKIVVSKAKEGSNNTNSIGVYVTFEKKDDAAKCIAAVDGSRNLDRPLRYSDESKIQGLLLLTMTIEPNMGRQSTARHIYETSNVQIASAPSSMRRARITIALVGKICLR